MTDYVIVCGRVPKLPATVEGFNRGSDLNRIKNLKFVDRGSGQNADIVAKVFSPFRKPFNDDGTICDGAIYQCA